MTGQADSNGSLDPLDAAVAEYLQQVEAGTRPDRDAVLVAHPDLADRLRAFFADLDRIGAHGESFRLPEVAVPGDFGDYEFLGEIGRGGMGVVYRVRQKSLDRIVALKMILSGPLASADAVRRFREEAETVARLDHPHILPIHDVGHVRGLPYFTMKLIEGESLTRRLDQYAYDLEATARLLVKVCDAVQHAHARGILHRDLKPGNVLIDAAGEPHVTDFGLARRVEEVRSLTTTGAVLGTPEYMAPEQAAGVKDLTTAADVYGLGSLLYVLLTGQPPFRADTAYATLRRVVEDSPTPPRKLRRNVPRDLDTICLKCLEKIPARRYASASDLADDLGRWLRGEPILARRIGPVERLRKWARRRPAAAAVLSVSLLSAVLFACGGSLFAWKLSTRNQELSQANQEVGEKKQQLEETLVERDRANTQLQDALWQSRREVYNLQLSRVAAIHDTDPKTTLDLLYDTDACPIDQRDVAWRFYENAARGHELGSRPGMLLADGPVLGKSDHQYPHDPYKGRRWVLVRAGDEPASITGLDRFNAIKARPLELVDLFSAEVKATHLDKKLGEQLELAAFVGHHGRGVVISQDGETLAWLAREVIHVCDARTGVIRSTNIKIQWSESTYLILSPTGRSLFLREARWENGKEQLSAKIYDLTTGNMLHEFEPSRFPVSTPRFSPDGRYLVYWSAMKEQEYALTLFDTTTRKLLPTIGSQVSRDGLWFAPDGFHLLRFQYPPRKVEDAPATMVLSVNEIREGAMKEVATIEFPRIDEDSKVSPDGSLIGIATGDGSIHLIDTKTWKLRLRLGGAYQRGRSFTFARDGRTLYSSRIDELWAWDTTSGERRFVRAGDHGDVLGVSERNHLFAVGSGPFDHLGQHIYSWDLTPSRPGHTMTPCTRVTGFGFSEDGRTFLRVERVRRWVKDDTVYTKPVEVVGFGQAVFGDEDPPPQKGYQVNNEDWVYDDNTTISLDLATGQTTRQKGYLPGIKVRPEGWMRLDQNNFSHATDSKAAPSKHLDRFGEVWTFDEDGDPKSAHSRATWLTNAKTQEKRRVPYDLPRQAIVLSPSPDGQSVLVASPNGSVELRDVWTGSLRATLTGHTSTVYEAIWSPDKQALATVSGDGTIKVWSMREPPIIGRWPGQHAAFTADGRSVLVYDRQRGDVAFRSQQTGQIERTATRPKDFNLNRLEVPDDGDLLVWRSSHELNARDRSNADKLALEYPAQSGTWYRPTVARNGRFAVVMKQVWNGMNGEQSRYKETLLRIDLSDRTERVLVELSDAGPQSREVWVHITSDSRQVVLAQYAAIQPPPKDGVVQSRQLAMKWTCYDAETKAVCWERTLPNDRLHWRTPDAPIHPSGRLAIVVGKDNTPRLYDLVSGDEKWQLPDWADTYTQTEFSPDGRWLATATEYGIVRILEVESGKSVATYDLRRAVPTARSAPSITELRFDLQGLRLAAGVRVGTSSESPTQVVVWNFVPEPPKTPARQ